MTRTRRLLLALLAVPPLLLMTVWLGFHWHPHLPPLPAPAAANASTAVRVTWLGVSTLLFDDGETAWMTDGFFTRPSALTVGLGKVAPNAAEIQRVLDQLGVTRLAAVIPLHAHYDHAMDAPIVAQRTHALLIGSASTAQIGLGSGLAPERIQVVPDAGGSVQMGAFHLQFIASQHAPEDHFPGQITQPLTPPARASAYKTGAAYSLLVTHHGKRVLVHPSAGFLPAALQGLQVDTVLLGVGLLGKQPTDFARDYWREVVTTTQAKRVIAIHWDDFFRPLGQPLRPLPWIADRIPHSLKDLSQRAQAAQLPLQLPELWQAFDPFQNP